MKFIKTVFALCFMAVMVFSGAGFLALAGGVLSLDRWAYVFSVLTSDAEYQVLLAVSGAILITCGLILPMRFIKKLRRARTISYKNNDGEITVSVAAIEEYVSKITEDIPEIDSIIPRAFFNKKGVNVICRVVINAGVNIQEITEMVQQGVKGKLRAILGDEDAVNVIIHIDRIKGNVPLREHFSGNEHGAGEVPFR